MKVEHLAAGSPKPNINSDTVYLYSMRFCPYAHRAHLALNAKNVEYIPIFINLTAKPSWYLDLFPAATVPGMNYKGEFLHESLLVADYVSDEFPGASLWPDNPLQKYKDKLLIEDFGKSQGAFYKCAMVEFNKSNFEDLLTGLRLLENELNERGSKYLGGAKPMMVDFMIWPWVERVGSLEILYGDSANLPDKEFPNLKNYISTMKIIPAIEDHYLTPEQHAKHYTLRKANDPNVFDLEY